ncbi:MAG: hypothetical protein GC164_02550 [Phycisphaera sp.]|nr:hypothetical protein [Phycisphaera sp.]
MRLTRSHLAVALAMWLIAFAGCEWKGGKGPFSSRGSVHVYPEGQFMIEPVAMRVYPSSKFMNEGGDTVLRARIELLDQMGDSVKGVGVYRFELYTPERASQAGDGRKLYGWDVPVKDLVSQKLYYDPITRSYLFRLKLEDRSTAQTGATLVVTFEPATGTRLSAQAALAAAESP